MEYSLMQVDEDNHLFSKLVVGECSRFFRLHFAYPIGPLLLILFIFYILSWRIIAFFVEDQLLFALCFVCLSGLCLSLACFFTSSGGLRSYEHPLNELKPVPRVDSSGDVCGANFKVDQETKKGGTGMPRVGSAANWSQHY